MASILTLIILILIGFLFMIGYFHLYKRNINKSLNDSSYSKRMIPPYRILTISTIIILVGYIGICELFPLNESNENNNQATVDFNVYSSNEIDGYLTQYSIEENNGYKKYVEEIDDTLFTYFVREDEYNTYHPTFIIFGEYIGEKDIRYFDFKGSFLDNEFKKFLGLGESGPEYMDYFLVVGNSNVDGYFQFDVYYYDNEVKYSTTIDNQVEIGKNADEKSSIVIHLP